MSQRSYHTADVHVLTGWDRPLQMFFLVVASITTGATRFSNLDDASFPWTDAAIVFDRLRRLGLEWPESLHKDLVTDAAQDVGNFRQDYGSVDVSASLPSPLELRPCSSP